MLGLKLRALFAVAPRLERGDVALCLCTGTPPNNEHTLGPILPKSWLPLNNKFAPVGARQEPEQEQDQSDSKSRSKRRSRRKRGSRNRSKRQCRSKSQSRSKSDIKSESRAKIHTFLELIKHRFFCGAPLEERDDVLLRTIIVHQRRRAAGTASTREGSSVSPRQWSEHLNSAPLFLRIVSSCVCCRFAG